MDNACKDFLRNTVITALQADPQAKVVVEGYRLDIEKENLDLQRAKNTRDRLADGNLGAQVDVNRITVRPGGVSTDSITQVKVWLVPSGAQDPPGAAPVDAGPVTPERKGRRR